ncbi:MAG: undecaprenyl-diphosphate phosphatase [Anaerolineales bacterium]
MTWYQALILGVVQGASEFLPISSSAHLVLVPWLLGWQLEPHAFFIFSVSVHWGTLAAVVVILRGDLLRFGRAALRALVHRSLLETPDATLGWLLVLATLPGALAGIVLGGLVEQAFSNPPVVAGLLLGTAGLLALGERSRSIRAASSAEFRPLTSLRTRDALVIGLAQAVALLPGISRSGATISAGLFRGLDRVEAVRFSFLMSVPIIFGAGLVALTDLASGPGAAESLPSLAIGFTAAGVVGYVAIRWLIRTLAGATFWGFAAYCALVGAAGLLLSVIRG